MKNIMRKLLIASVIMTPAIGYAGSAHDHASKEACPQGKDCMMECAKGKDCSKDCAEKEKCSKQADGDMSTMDHEKMKKQ